MGKHHAPRGLWPHRPRQTAGTGKPVDPHDRELIEPDRDGAEQLTEEEHAAREASFTDRDPQDDIHLAAQDAADRDTPS